MDEDVYVYKSTDLDAIRYFLDEPDTEYDYLEI